VTDKPKNLEQCTHNLRDMTLSTSPTKVHTHFGSYHKYVNNFLKIKAAEK